MDAIHKQVTLDLEWNRRQTERYYNNRRSEAPQIQEGQLVYLRRRTIGRNEYNIKTKRTSDKLDCVHLGPFKVLEKLNHDNYKLALPPRMQIHPEFHVSILKPAESDESKVSVEEFEVEAVTGRRVNDRDKTEYLIQWKGYPGEDTWEEVTNLHCPEEIRKFEQTEDPRQSRKRLAQSRSAKERPQRDVNRNGDRQSKVQYQRRPKQA